MTLCGYFNYVLECELLFSNFILSFILIGSMYMFKARLSALIDVDMLYQHNLGLTLMYML
jgi:hypothetical protein